MLTTKLTQRLNQTPITHAILTHIDETLSTHYHCKIQENPKIQGNPAQNFTITLGHKTNRAHHQHNKLETHLTINNEQITIKTHLTINNEQINSNTRQPQTVDLNHPKSLDTITQTILQTAQKWQNQHFPQQNQ